MNDFGKSLELASRAMCDGKFREADDVLQEALADANDSEDKNMILQSLVHLYSHPLNEDFDKAESYMKQRESLNPSGATALSYAYFESYTRQDQDAAQRWAKTAIVRASDEHDSSTLYSAAAIVGITAANKGDSTAVAFSLQQIAALLEEEPDDINYSDAVALLELTAKRSDFTDITRHIAQRIASRIQDPEFRAKAQAIARNGKSASCQP